MLIRMFHVDCDARLNYECEGETGDEWYSAEAKRRARNAGWVFRANGETICATCWEAMKKS